MTTKTLMFEDTQLNRFRDWVRTQRFKNMKYDEIKYLRSFTALLVLITMKFFKQLRPKQLQTTGLKRHHHIRMDNIKCSTLLTF